MQESIPFYFLALARPAVGAAAWISPTLTCQIFGMGNQASESPHFAMMLRLFGVRYFFLSVFFFSYLFSIFSVFSDVFFIRDFAFGSSLFLLGPPSSNQTSPASRGALRLILQLGLIVDSLDVVSFLIAHNQKPMTPIELALTAGGALAFIGIEAYLLQRLNKRHLN